MMGAWQPDPRYCTSNDTAFRSHTGSASNYQGVFQPGPRPDGEPSTNYEADQAKAQLRQEHREECRRAFKDKPRRERLTAPKRREMMPAARVAARQRSGARG